MRLGAYLLAGALALPAQVAGTLPWSGVPALPWKVDEGAPAPAPLEATRKALALTVHLAPDGALRISDDQGVLRLRLGLPGRPLKVWRDWGLPVANPFAPLAFPASSPLSRGLGNLPVGARDFRPALEGLLWILDDDEKLITLIHPATAQVVYLPLPGGQNPTLVFHPDRLESQETPSSRGERGAARWSLPWLALLPQFIRLSQEAQPGGPTGTALVPFAKD